MLKTTNQFPNCCNK